MNKIFDKKISFCEELENFNTEDGLEKTPLKFNLLYQMHNTGETHNRHIRGIKGREDYI